MGKNNSKVCPKCNEKNNPVFTSCWKCKAQFENGIPSPRVEGKEITSEELVGSLWTMWIRNTDASHRMLKEGFSKNGFDVSKEKEKKFF